MESTINTPVTAALSDPIVAYAQKLAAGLGWDVTEAGGMTATLVAPHAAGVQLVITLYKTTFRVAISRYSSEYLQAKRVTPDFIQRVRVMLVDPLITRYLSEQARAIQATQDHEVALAALQTALAKVTAVTPEIRDGWESTTLPAGEGYVALNGTRRGDITIQADHVTPEQAQGILAVLGY